MPYEIGIQGDLIASRNLKTWINTLRSGYETDFPNGHPSLDCYLCTMVLILAAFIESEWRETGRNDAALNLQMRRQNFDKAKDVAQVGGHLQFVRASIVNRTACEDHPRELADVLGKTELDVGQHRRHGRTCSTGTCCSTSPQNWRTTQPGPARPTR